MANFGMFLSVLIPIAVLGIIVFFVMAIVAEAKSASKGGAVRSAFSYVVSLVMLFMMVASSAFLLQQGLRAWVFTKAESSSINSGPPPTFYVTATSDKPVDINSVAYSCKDTCQLSDVDKQNFTTWKQSYADWKKDNAASTGKFTVNQKRDIVNALSFFIVALPIFWWFFIRTIQREVRKMRQEGRNKPGPLRASYFYLVAFTGLIGVVVSVALLVNLGLKRITGIQSTTARPVPSMVGPSFEQNGVRSIANCTEKCGLTADDKALAEQWLADYDAWQKKNTTSFPPQTSTQTDLANVIPILIVALPLFLYHFFAIRRESAEDMPSQPSAPVTTT